MKHSNDWSITCHTRSNSDLVTGNPRNNSFSIHQLAENFLEDARVVGVLPVLFIYFSVLFV